MGETTRCSTVSGLRDASNVTEKRIRSVFGKFSKSEGPRFFSERGNFSGRTRRAYRLSKAGRASLVASINRHRPWDRSTGPRTAKGKARCALNGLHNRDLWRVVSETATSRLHANGVTTESRHQAVYFIGGKVVRAR